MQTNQQSYRQLNKLIQSKVYNDNNKRTFGRDITNLNQRIKKNITIYQKIPSLPQQKLQPKNKSYSTFTNKQKSLDHKPIQYSLNQPILDYKQDIIDFILKLQKNKDNTNPITPPTPQKNITQRMKQILIDWLIDVHASFQLKQQTLYLALSYLQDYSAIRQITKQQYQLVGITCLWIATKYQEIYPPKMKNYIQVTADTYTLKDLKMMEGSIIEALNFDLNRTTALQLLQAMTENSQNMNQKAMSLCKYAIQTAIFEGLALKHSTNSIVMAALHLCQNIFKLKIQPKLQPSSPKSSMKQIMDCFKDLIQILHNGNKFDLTAIKRKYTRSKYCNVAKLKFIINQ